jgi:hypothetical protein
MSHVYKPNSDVRYLVRDRRVERSLRRQTSIPSFGICPLRRTDASDIASKIKWTKQSAW